MNYEQVIENMRKNVRTGFARHPNGKSYHGFTCPNCGRHEFGTSSFPNGVTIGHCHGNSYAANGCTFSWDRSNQADEDNAVHTMTSAEWMEQLVQDLRVV